MHFFKFLIVIEGRLINRTCYLQSMHDGQIDVIYTDFQKAFVHINHNILIYKLGGYGVSYDSDALIKLIQSYLQDRKQTVVYNVTVIVTLS